jgi:TRAP-type C4-dicarboxylate transport system permease small subunit
MKHLRRFDRLCARVERTAVVLIFSTLVLLLCVNIAARSLFQTSFHRILELVPALVLWLAMFGSTLALRQSRHIKIELLLRYCPPRFQAGLRRISSLFGMIVMGILFATALQFLKNEIGMFGAVGWLSIILPIFFALSFFRFFLHALDPQGDADPRAAQAPRSPSWETRRS